MVKEAGYTVINN